MRETDRTVPAGATVMLHGSSSSDDDGMIASYAWSQTSGSPAVELSDPTIANPSFTTSAEDAPATLVFTLTVTDDRGAQAEAMVSISLVELLPIISTTTALTAPSEDGNIVGWTFTATDDYSAATTWHHVYIEADADCDASAFAGQSFMYTEGSVSSHVTNITFNGRRVCLRSAAGANIGYGVTDVISGIVRRIVIGFSSTTYTATVESPLRVGLTLAGVVRFGRTINVAYTVSAEGTAIAEQDYISAGVRQGLTIGPTSNSFGTSRSILFPKTAFIADGDTTAETFTLMLVMHPDAMADGFEVVIREGYGTATVTIAAETVPDAPSLALAADTGTKGDDGITRNAQVDVTLDASATAWEYSINSGVNYMTGRGAIPNVNFVLPEDTYTVGQVRVRQTVGTKESPAASLGAVTVDTTAPTVTNFDNITGATVGTQTTTTITFSEVVTDLEATAFGTSTAATVTAVSGGTTSYTITYTPTMESFTLSLAENSVMDTAGNTAPAAAAAAQGTAMSAPNRPPTADAGENLKTVFYGVMVMLDGSASSDPEGMIETYAWSQTGGSPAVELIDANTVSPSFTAPSSNGFFTFELTVTDAGGLFDKASVLYIVRSPPNTLPLADAGPAQRVFYGATVTLDGSASSDPDGMIVAYAWEQISGPSVELSDPATANPSFTTSAEEDVVPATLVFTLTVTDDKGDQASANVSLGITAPRKASAPTLTATLGPGDNQVELSWTVPADRGDYPIDGYRVEYTGARSLTISLDIPAGTTARTVEGLMGGETYEFKVYAVTAAGNGADSNSYRITLPAPPRPADPITNLVADVLTTIGMTTLTWDAYPGYAGTYTVLRRFHEDFSPNAGTLREYKTTSKTSITFAAGTEFRSGRLQGLFVYRISIPDPDSPGEKLFSDVLESAELYEGSNSHGFEPQNPGYQYVVPYNKPTTLDFRFTITIPRCRRPPCSLAVSRVTGAGAVSALQSTTTGQGGSVAVISTDRPYGQHPADASDVTPFRCDGGGALIAQDMVRQVSYTPPAGGKSGPDTFVIQRQKVHIQDTSSTVTKGCYADGAAEDVTIILDSEPNAQPVIATTHQSVMHAENTPVTTRVATYALTATSMAASADTAETIVWSLGGTDEALFAIDSATGGLTFKVSPDYESAGDDGADNGYAVTVIATDNGDPPMAGTLAVTVEVTNADDSGTVTVTGTAQVSSTLTASSPKDPDGSVSSVSWQWQRAPPDGGYGDISGATMQTYTPEAIDADNTLRVVASYTDPLGSGKTTTSAPTTVVAGADAPAAPTLALAADTGTKGDDGITSNAQVDVTLDTGDGTTWEYSTDSGMNYMTGTGTSFMLPEGTYTIVQVQVRQTVAGAVSVIASLGVAITVDTTAPTGAFAALPDLVVGEAAMVTFTLSEPVERALTIDDFTITNARDTSSLSRSDLVYAITFTPDMAVQTSITFAGGVMDAAGNAVATVTSMSTAALPNQLPVANAGTDQADVMTGATVTLDGSASNDPDGEIATRAWEQISGTDVSLSDAAAESPTFTAPATAGGLVFTLTVTDDEGASTTDTVTITVVEPPSTDATLSTLTLSAGTLVPVFASNIDTYTASVANGVTDITVTPTTADTGASVTVSGAVVTSGSASNEIALAVGDTPITIVVTAEDGTTMETYTVDITRAEPPSTDATLSSVTLSAGTLVPVFASNIDTYTASVANGVTDITVTPTTADTGASVTVSGDVVTSGSASNAIALGVGDTPITIVVTAEDGTTMGPYTVVVTRAEPPNTEPVIESTHQSVMHAENTPVTTVVATYVLTADSMDAEEIIVWSLEGTDRALFAINSATGGLTFKVSPDYESPGDDGADNGYTVTVIATDNGDPPRSGELAVTVEVTNADDSGTVTVTGTAQVGSTLTANTPEDPDGSVSSISWQWQRAPSGGAYADIASSATTATYIPIAADVNNTLRVVASYTDPLGSGKTATSAPTATVVSAPVPDAPTLALAADTGTADDDGITSNAQVDVTLDASATAWEYSINSGVNYMPGSGAIPNVNFVLPEGTYEDARVQVRQTVGGVLSAVASLGVAITVDTTAPTVMSFEVISGATVGMLTTTTITFSEAVTGLEATDFSTSTDATVTAVSGGTTSYTITYTPAMESFTLSLAENSVMDIAGNTAPAAAASAQGTAMPAPNQPPTADAGADQADVITGASVMLDGSASNDPDSGDMLRYRWEQISGSPSVTLSDSAAAKPTFTAPATVVTLVFTLTVTDNDGASTTAMVTITVTPPPNTAPTISGGASVDYRESVTSGVWTYSLNDTDGDNLSVTLEGVDTDLFRFELIDSRTRVRLYFRNQPDFEAPQDASGNNRYHVTIVATDDGSPPKTGELAVRVRVTNVDEPGTVTIDTTPGVGDALTASLADPDGSVSSISWQWQRAPSGGAYADIASSATAATYTPVAADVGYTLQVVASYIDGHGSGKTATSAPTAMVMSAPVPAAPSLALAADTGTKGDDGITRNAQVDVTLNASATAWEYSINSGMSYMTGSGAIPNVNFVLPEGTYEDAQVQVRQTVGGVLSAVASLGAAVTVDTTAPTVASFDDITGATADTQTTTTITFSEAVTGLDATDFGTSTDATVTTVSDGPTNYTVTYMPTMLPFTLTLAANSVMDTAGNTAPAAAASAQGTAEPAPNQPPTADAGADQADVITGATVMLDGSASNDPDSGDTLRYLWEQISGSPAVALSNTAAASPTFAAPATTATLVFRLTVTDNAGAAATAMVTITVTPPPNTKPVIAPTHQSVMHAEHTLVTTVVATYALTTASMDAEEIIVWSLGGTDGALFAINSATGGLTFKVSPDYESPGDDGADNGYAVTVIATDNGSPPMLGDLAVTVTVTNVDEPGTVTVTGTAQVGSTLTANPPEDPDGSVSSISWRWQRAPSDGDGTYTAISGATMQTYTPEAIDADNTLRVVASYTDPLGSGKTATSAPTAAVVSAFVPDAPRNLAASPGDLEVTLTWRTPRNDGGFAISGYQYRQSETSGKYAEDDWVDILTSGAGTTIHIVTGLDNDIEYFFQVRAMNEAGNSAPSNEASITLAEDFDNIQPTVSSITSTTANGTYGEGDMINITVTLSEAINHNTLLVYLQIGSAVEEVAVEEVAVEEDVEGANPVVYTGDYTVQAGDNTDRLAAVSIETDTFDVPTDAAGNEIDFYIRPFRNLFDNNIAIDTSPTVVTFAAITDAVLNSANTTTITFSEPVIGLGAGDFSSSTNATVHAMTGSDATYSITYTPTAASFTLTLAADSVTDATGNTGPAVAVSALGRTPSNAATLSDLALSSGSLVPTFLPATTTYKVSVANIVASIAVTPTTTDPAASVTVNRMAVTSGTVSQVIFLIEGVKTPIEVVVTAEDTTTIRTYTLAVTREAVTTLTAPTAPTDTRAAVGDTQVTLTWNAPASDGGAAISGYQYRQSETAGDYTAITWTEITNSAAATSYTVTDLTNGTTYYFQVRAMNSIGNGTASNEVSATPGLSISDLDGDSSSVSLDDAKFLYYTRVLESELEARDVRATVLGPLLPDGTADDELLRLLGAARDSDRPRPLGDLNEDGETTAAEVAVLYYSFALEGSLGNGGSEPGIPAIKRVILGPLLGPLVGDPNDVKNIDDAIDTMLQKAHSMRRQ